VPYVYDVYPQEIYWLFTALPIWAIALLLFVGTIGVIFVLRDRCEGLYYQTSYSAQLGDGALIVVALIAAGIMQRGVFFIPWYMMHQGGRVCAVLLSIALGLVWFIIDQPEHWGDRYHHLVIAPVLCYLGLTLVPVIFMSGNRIEKSATILLIMSWAVLVVYDAVTHRLDQRSYRGLGEYLNRAKKQKRKERKMIGVHVSLLD